MYDHPHFTYIKQVPTWQDVETEFKKSGICDLTLNARVLNREEGFALHRVVLVDITDNEVIFHDPNRLADGAYRREPLGHFKKAFTSVEAPELARYSLNSA